MSLTASQLRERIDAAQDIPREPVAIPEWGIGLNDGLFLKGLTGSERDAFEKSVFEQKGNTARVKTDQMRSRLVALSLVDSEDARIYSDADIKALGAKSAAVLDRLFAMAMKFSGLSPDDVKELAETFADAPSEEDGSDSLDI